MAGKLRYYDVYLGGVKLGTMQKDDSFGLQFENKKVMLEDVAGLIGTADAKSYGLTPRVEFSLYDADSETVHGKILKNYTTTVTSGANKAYEFGTKLIDLLELSEELLLHPADISDLSDRSQDYKFWKAAIDPDGFKVNGSQQNYQQFDISIIIFPDQTQSQSRTFGVYGDPSITNTPLGTWIQAGRKANSPGKQLTALTVTTSQVEQLQCFCGFGGTTSTSTAAINNGAGYTATDTSLVYDTLSGSFVADTVYKINTEYLKVTAVTPSSTTEGTLTVIRGVWGSTAATITDNDVITMLKDASVENMTDVATWASDSASNVSVGNTYAASDTTKKGVIAHVATGSANITATVNAVASPNCAVTAS